MQWNHDLLLETLREGSRRAARLKRSILVSVAQPIEPGDLLQLFMAAQALKPSTLVYWEHMADRSALLGIEAAAAIQLAGPDCFAEASAVWRKLFQDGVVRSSQAEAFPDEQGPVLFGGFAFDPVRPRSQLWEGFPDGLLLLPAILLRSCAGSTMLHLQAIVRPAGTPVFDVG